MSKDKDKIIEDLKFRIKIQSRVIDSQCGDLKKSLEDLKAEFNEYKNKSLIQKIISHFKDLKNK